jgi:hypothetical protein
MTFVSDDEAQAAKEIAKTGGKLIDAAVGVGGFLRQTLGTIPEDMIGLAGGDWVHQQRRRNIGKMMAKTERMLEGVAPERITEPSVSVVLPLLEAAADETREDLQELWAALLANATLDGGKRVRRVFFEIVKRMEPNDAVIFRIIGKHTGHGARVSSLIDQDRTRAGVGQSEFQVALEVLAEMKLINWKTDVGLDPRLLPLGHELLAMCEGRGGVPH